MIPNLQGRTALVTGANSGVGLELTKSLLNAGAEVAALVRSDFAPEDALDRARTEGRLRVYRADFADWASLRRGLAEVKAAETKLDLLFNNAGVAFPDLRDVAGLDGHFAVNTVAPFLVLEELGPLLERGNLKTVVQTSSIALRFAKNFSLESLESPTRYVPIVGPYAASKLALSLWTREAADYWQGKGIRIVSACPGGTKTKMTARPQLWFMRLLSPLLFHSAAEGARRLLLAAFAGSPAGAFHSGPKGKVVEPGFLAEGPRILNRLRELYEKEFRSPLATATGTV